MNAPETQCALKYIKIYALLFFFTFCAFTTHAQSIDTLSVDQLWNLGNTRLKEFLKKPLSDSVRFKVCIALAQRLDDKAGSVRQDLDSAFTYLAEAKRLSLRMRVYSYELEELRTLAAVHFSAGDIRSGKAVYLQAIGRCRAKGDPAAEARIWFDLGSKYPWEYSREKMQYYQHAYRIYASLHDVIQQGLMLKAMADVHLNSNQVNLAEKELKQVLVLFKSAHYPKLHYTYDLLAAVSRRQGDINKTLYYSLAAVQSARATKDTINGISIFYWRVGDAYQDAGNIPKSIEYYEKSYQNAVLLGGGLLYHAINELTVLLIQTGQVNKAIRIINNAYKRQPPADPAEKKALAFSLGDCYLAKKDYARAEKYYTMYIDAVGEGDDFQAFWIKISRFYISQGRYDKASKYVQLLHRYGNANGVPTRRRDIHLLSFKLDSATGKPWSAINYLQQYKRLNDSIFNAEKFKLVEELQVKFNTAEKEKDNQLLRNRTALQDKKPQNENLIKNSVIVGCAVLLLIVLLLFNRYQIKQYANNELTRQQEIILDKNQALEQIINQKTKLVGEKEFLLKEIHHRVKNNLQLTMSLLNSQSHYLTNEDAVKAIREGQHRLKSIALVHQKLYQGNDINTMNLKSYISEIIAYLKDSFDGGRQVHFDTAIEDIEIDISQAVSIGLFLNEAITNIFKYAFTDMAGGLVKILIRRTSGQEFEMLIKDNGKGLPADFDSSTHRSLGITLMKGLSAQLDGSFSMYSDHGTTVHMTFSIEPVMEI